MTRLLILVVVLSCWISGSAAVTKTFHVWDRIKKAMAILSPANPTPNSEDYTDVAFDGFPWVPAGCKPDFCDPSPVFKIVEKQPYGDVYNLLEIITPANTEDYHELLTDPARSRLCTGSAAVHPNCSYLQEFVIDNDENQPLQILGIFDKGYGELYYRLHLATVPAPGANNVEADHNEDYYYLMIGGLLIALTVVTTACCCCLCCCLWKNKKMQDRDSLANSQIERRRPRNQRTTQRWQEAARATRNTGIEVPKPYVTRPQHPRLANVVELQMSHEQRWNRNDGNRFQDAVIRRTGDLRPTGLNSTPKRLSSNPFANTMESCV